MELVLLLKVRLSNYHMKSKSIKYYYNSFLVFDHTLLFTPDPQSQIKSQKPLELFNNIRGGYEAIKNLYTNQRQYYDQTFIIFRKKPFIPGDYTSPMKTELISIHFNLNTNQNGNVIKQMDDFKVNFVKLHRNELASMKNISQTQRFFTGQPIEINYYNDPIKNKYPVKLFGTISKEGLVFGKENSFNASKGEHSFRYKQMASCKSIEVEEDGINAEACLRFNVVWDTTMRPTVLCSSQQSFQKQSVDKIIIYATIFHDCFAYKMQDIIREYNELNGKLENSKESMLEKHKWIEVLNEIHNEDKDKYARKSSEYQVNYAFLKPIASKIIESLTRGQMESTEWFKNYLTSKVPDLNLKQEEINQVVKVNNNQDNQFLSKNSNAPINNENKQESSELESTEFLKGRLSPEDQYNETVKSNFKDLFLKYNQDFIDKKIEMLREVAKSHVSNGGIKDIRTNNSNDKSNVNDINAGQLNNQNIIANNKNSAIFGGDNNGQFQNRGFITKGSQLENQKKVNKEDKKDVLFYKGNVEGKNNNNDNQNNVINKINQGLIDNRLENINMDVFSDNNFGNNSSILDKNSNSSNNVGRNQSNGKYYSNGESNINGANNTISSNGGFNNGSSNGGFNNGESNINGRLNNGSSNIGINNGESNTNVGYNNGESNANGRFNNGESNINGGFNNGNTNVEFNNGSSNVGFNNVISNGEFDNVSSNGGIYNGNVNERFIKGESNINGVYNNGESNINGRLNNGSSNIGIDNGESNTNGGFNNGSSNIGINNGESYTNGGFNNGNANGGFNNISLNGGLNNGSSKGGLNNVISNGGFNNVSSNGVFNNGESNINIGFNNGSSIGGFNNGESNINSSSNGGFNNAISNGGFNNEGNNANGASNTNGGFNNGASFTNGGVNENNAVRAKSELISPSDISLFSKNNGENRYMWKEDIIKAQNELELPKYIVNEPSIINNSLVESILDKYEVDSKLQSTVNYNIQNEQSINPFKVDKTINLNTEENGTEYVILPPFKDFEQKEFIKEEKPQLITIDRKEKDELKKEDKIKIEAKFDKSVVEGRKQEVEHSKISDKIKITAISESKVIEVNKNDNIVIQNNNSENKKDTSNYNNTKMKTHYEKQVNKVLNNNNNIKMNVNNEKQVNKVSNNSNNIKMNVKYDKQVNSVQNITTPKNNDTIMINAKYHNAIIEIDKIPNNKDQLSNKVIEIDKIPNKKDQLSNKVIEIDKLSINNYLTGKNIAQTLNFSKDKNIKNEINNNTSKNNVHPQKQSHNALSNNISSFPINPNNVFPNKTYELQPSKPNVSNNNHPISPNNPSYLKSPNMPNDQNIQNNSSPNFPNNPSNPNNINNPSNPNNPINPSNPNSINNQSNPNNTNNPSSINNQNNPSNQNNQSNTNSNPSNQNNQSNTNSNPSNTNSNPINTNSNPSNTNNNPINPNNTNNPNNVSSNPSNTNSNPINTNSNQNIQNNPNTQNNHKNPNNPNNQNIQNKPKNPHNQNNRHNLHNHYIPSYPSNQSNTTNQNNPNNQINPNSPNTPY